MIGLKECVVVGVGGGLGAVGRFILGTLITPYASDTRFPVGTFVVNVLGCFVGGLLTAALDDQPMISPNVRLFLIVGLLGGFTTFSAFGLESVTLLRRGEVGMALAYVLASVVGGIAAFAIGLKTFQS